MLTLLRRASFITAADCTVMVHKEWPSTVSEKGEGKVVAGNVSSFKLYHSFHEFFRRWKVTLPANRLVRHALLSIDVTILVPRTQRHESNNDIPCYAVDYPISGMFQQYLS